MKKITLILVLLCLTGIVFAEDTPKDIVPTLTAEQLPGAICGDGVCEPPETEDICCEDCKLGGCESIPGLDNCGNGVCDLPETRENCAEDCNPQGFMNQEAMNSCGDGICELPETQDRCCDDCGGCMDVVKKAGDELIDEASTNMIHGFFSRITGFFRKLFGHREATQTSPMQVIEDDETGEKIYIEGSESPNTKIITETTEKDGRVIKNTLAVDVE